MRTHELVTEEWRQRSEAQESPEGHRCEVLTAQHHCLEPSVVLRSICDEEQEAPKGNVHMPPLLPLVNTSNP